MARNQFEDDDDQFEDEPMSESDLLKQLRRQLREANKKLGEYDTELSTLRQKTRVTELSDVVKSKGLDPRVAKLYPKDADATPEAVDAWLAEFGDVFGLQPSEEPNEPAVDPATIAAHRRMANAEGTALPATKETEVLAKLQNAATAEELLSILQNGG